LNIRAAVIAAIRELYSLLFDVSSTDAFTFVAIPLLFALVAPIGLLVPS